MEALRKHTNETQDLALENSTAVYAMNTSHSSQSELGFSSASVDVIEAKKLKESKMRKLVIKHTQFECVQQQYSFERFLFNGFVFCQWIHSHILPSYAHANNGGYVFTS